MKVAIMAGGLGSRLKPMTLAIPKPLIPIGEKPILEILIRSLKKQGFDDIVLCVGYKSELIKAYFGDGRKYGVKISYFKERKRLGTAGPLRVVRDIFKIKEPILMMNGDILTDLDFRKVVEFHKRNKGELTIATKEKEMATKYGVIDIKADRVTGVREKPSFRFRISTGIYVVNPRVLDAVKPYSYFDMPELIQRMVDVKRNVLSYDVKDFWKAIDRMEDLEMANSEAEQKIIRNMLR